MSGENHKKPWEYPWTTEEIIENASNWSLASDVALLKTLESFSDNLLRKTQETDRNLNRLLQKLDETSLKLDITKNEFLSLHNRQFVESRVYEEDESVNNENEEMKEKDVEKPKTDDEITAEMKEAVLAGLKMVEKYYYRSEVPANNSDYDSDDSNSVPLYALTLKDPYVDRPLPHVIGTQEWHQKWHVGLQESSSESENEVVSEKFSDTDSESDLPVSNRATTQRVKDSDIDLNEKPIANSTFGRDVDVVSESSGSDDLGGSVPVKTPISSVNFAEQLAAKLGNVINQRLPQEDDDVVNKRPIQKTTIQSNRFSAGLFSDEPPPLDDDDDDGNDSSEENVKKGLFSGGQGLFDNDDDSVIPINQEEINNKPTKVISSGLFNDDEDEENDLFSTAITKIDTKKPFLSNSPKPTSLPLYNNEPPELDEVDTENRQEKSIKSAVETRKEGGVVEKTHSKKVSLFDDDDTLFEDDLFANITTKKFTSNLFDDIPPSPPPIEDDVTEIKTEEERDIPSYIPTSTSIFNDEPPPLDDDIFSTLKIPPSKKESQNKLASLFDDDDNRSLEDDLFLNNKPNSSSSSSSKNKLSSLDTENFVKNTKQKFFSETDKKLEVKNDDVTEEKSPVITKERKSLFEDTDEFEADIFCNTDFSHTNENKPNDVLVEEKDSFTVDKPIIKPPIKTELPTKSTENKDTIVSVKQTKKLLFENDTNIETKPEVLIASPGKLKHNLNINVNALMPGAVRPTLLVKSQSLEIKNDADEMVKEDSSTEVSVCEEKPVSFDDEHEIETLKSVTKDRVKIPIKRRPSTRKARQEQLRHSVPDFKLATPITDSAIFTETVSPQEIVSVKKGKPLFPQEEILSARKTTTTSLFDSPDSDSDDMFKIEKKTKVITSDLFAKDDGLFGTRKSPIKKDNDIFNDDDTEDIFSTKKLPPKSDLIKKSLFDDDLDDENDDDDIFGNASVKVTNVAAKKEIKPQKATIRKLNATEMENDPLNALQTKD